MSKLAQRVRVFRHQIEKAVGYVRVSTEKQARDGVGLDAQILSITQFAQERGIKLLSIHEDDLSGMGSHVLKKNVGLSDAIRDAQAHRAPLLVHDLSRVARNTSVISQITGQEGVSIVTVTDGVVLDGSELHRQAAWAQIVGERISRTTKEALAREKAAGRLLGNRKNLHEAQRRGAISNISMADAKAEEIAEVLSEMGPKPGLTAHELTLVLNSRGILSRQGKLWTSAALRRPLQRAKKLLAIEAEIQMEADPRFGRFG